jgi:hypothetical protein
MPQWADQNGWGDQSEAESIIIPYHEPIESRRSLEFITADFQQFLSKSENLQERDDIRSCSHRQFDVDDEEAYALYTDSPTGVPNEWRGTEEEVTEYVGTIFDERELPLLRLVFTAFKSVTEDVEEGTMTMYKTSDLESLVEAFRKVQWRQSVAIVGAQILSRFLCQHPLPNTNHRTGIDILERYVQTVDENVEFPDTGADDKWHNWAKEYVFSSKRILTFRQGSGVLAHAHSLGVEKIQRKDNLIIDLSSELADQQGSGPSHPYTQEHQQRTRAFVDQLLERSGATHLRDETDGGMRVFLDRIGDPHPFGDSV